jgi:AcrR family transcriptional regulator
MEQTRERILDQVAILLAENGDVTVAEAAKRANVSVRTAYRYFPTRDALLDGINQWSHKRFGMPKLPETLDEGRELVSTLVRGWSANEALVRASRRPGIAAEAKKRRKSRQIASLTALCATEAPDVDPEHVRRVAATVHQLISADTWLNMRDDWGFSDDECIAAVLDAVDALIAKLRRDQQHAKKAKR